MDFPRGFVFTNDVLVQAFAAALLEFSRDATRENTVKILVGPSDASQGFQCVYVLDSVEFKKHCWKDQSYLTLFPLSITIYNKGYFVFSIKKTITFPDSHPAPT
ncbi:MAG: hypothetical protein N2C14_21865 [Planctomycetales bacterium]